MLKNVFFVVAMVLMTGCAPRTQMSVLIHMMKDQEAYFNKEVVPSFEEKNKADIEVIHYENLDSLEYEMKKRAGKVGLVKVPFDKSTALLRKGLFKTLDSFLSPEEIKKFEDDYLLTSQGTVDGKSCLIPRKFETRIMVYCKSKVNDAIASWRKYKDSIDQDLKHFNGFGLPADYLLEEDPNEWDYYDIYVAGWIWGHTTYDGKTGPRVAHRGKRYSGTSLRIIDRVFQLNGDSSSVLHMKGNSVVDAIHWEALYASSGIYNPKMWEKGWSGADVWQGFADGEVFLSFMTQLDCFFLHGTGRDNLNGFFKNPDDMVVATMPAGCSVELDKAGMPVRNGGKAITTGGWWWGIPFDSPDPHLSFELATHITANSSQIQECSRFGMIPVRKDILGDMSMLFGGGWITNVYNVSFRQLMHNGHTVIPGNTHFEQIASLYLDLWYDIVVNKNWSADKLIPDRNYITETIKKVYVPRAEGVLRGE